MKEAELNCVYNNKLYKYIHTHTYIQVYEKPDQKF